MGMALLSIFFACQAAEMVFMAAIMTYAYFFEKLKHPFSVWVCMLLFGGWLVAFNAFSFGWLFKSLSRKTLLKFGIYQPIQ